MLSLACIAVPVVHARETHGPTLAPKPYRIGIAPSHITKPTEPLFDQRADDWEEVRKQIDFYKVYSLQATPPDWATPLPVNAFAKFVKDHHIQVDAEFGNFRASLGGGKAAAERARAMHAWMRHRDVKLHSLHLDGPIRRMMRSDRETKRGLTLEETAEEIAEFLVESRRIFPETRFGLITNFPNWHYTPAHPGMLGTWTNRNGVHYRDALEAVYLAAKRKKTRIDFVEVDCPFNYYRATANRTEPTRRVDNAKKFKALQKWCEDREIEFWLIVNFDTNPQKVANKPELGNRFFHDNTLAYIRRLRRDGIFPDCFTIQSWYKLPGEHLPEDGGYSFMHTARDSIRLIRELYPQPNAAVGHASEEVLPVKVILDTDMSGDCDDAGTLGLLHALADRGECELLAVTTNRMDLANASAGAVDAINTYYGRPDIPIGVGRQAPTALQRTSPYALALRREFPNDIGPDHRAPDALDVFRQVLGKQPDSSVTICSVGALTNMAGLWRRYPDLVRKKVRCLIVMGGEYPRSQRPRTNIATHVEAARTVADQWPTEITWHGFEVGNVLITGERLKETPKNNPVRRAYELRPYSGRFAIDGGQPSYDQAAALFAVRGAAPAHWAVASGGRVSINEKGMTTWEASPSGTHAYVKIAGEPERLAREIEDLMIAPPKHESMSRPVPPTDEVLKYLKSLGNGSYLFGQVATWVHNENPDMDHPGNWLRKVYDCTGRMPRYGTVTYDFHDNPFPDAKWNNGVKKMWDRGMIVGVFTFFANPSGQSWNAPLDIDPIFDAGDNPTKRNFYKQMDRMAANLRWLSDRGVPVVYTPFVESDDRNKWHAKETCEHAKKLYRLVHDYFTNHKNLNNIIWAYHVTQNHGALEKYYPGDAYVDVLGKSAYGRGLPFSEYDWALGKKKNAGKVIWWSELGIRGRSEPRADCMDVLRKLENSYPELAGFVFWSDDGHYNVIGNNNGRAFMASARIITLK